MDGTVGVDAQGRLGVQVAYRVVGDRSQVDHGVETLQVGRSLVTDVPGALLVVRRWGPEVAPVVPADVEADDLVAGLLQEGDHHGPDVSTVSVDQHAHG